jgi:mitochondrial chaperone BCS1
MVGWLSRQDTFRKARFLEISTRRSTGNEGFLLDDDDNKDNARVLKYVPSAGITYTLWFKNRWMQVTRIKAEKNNDDYWRRSEDSSNP